MKNYVFFIINGKPTTILADESELSSLKNQFGQMFSSLPEAKRVAEEMKKETEMIRYYTDEERKELEREQIAFGRSKMTDEEKAEAKRERKTIDQLQIEFGRMMMRKEMETCFA